MWQELHEQERSRKVHLIDEAELRAFTRGEDSQPKHPGGSNQQIFWSVEKPGSGAIFEANKKKSLVFGMKHEFRAILKDNMIHKGFRCSKRQI